MSVLVVGASGLMGRKLCNKLISQSIPVIATTRGRPVDEAIPGLTWRTLRLATFNRWDRLLRDVQTIYHLGWSTIPSTASLDPAADVADNVVGTLKLLEAARKRPAIRLVFASSGGAVYGPSAPLPNAEDAQTKPVSAFGVSKLMVEQYIAQYRTMYGFDGIALRFGNCYGASQKREGGIGAITLFARAALMDEPITIFGTNNPIRDYVHIDDVIEALVIAGRKRNVAGPINIGSGRGHSLTDIIAVLQRITGKQLKIQYTVARPFDLPASILDISKASRDLGWIPQVSFEEGIRSVVQELQVEMNLTCGSQFMSTATSRTTILEPKRMRGASRTNLQLLATDRSS